MPENSRTVLVIGQGYVGLPLAVRAAQVGFTVIGIDLDSRRIEALKNKESYVDDISSDLLHEVFETGRYSVVDNYDEVEGYDFAIITVPTPLRDSLPDLSFIESAAESLAPKLRSGATVVLESTTYPGTTEELLTPILEAGSGLVADRDFYVGYSPERIDPGNKEWGLVETPKVVSGISGASLKQVKSLYDELVNTTVAVNGTKEAELTKLLENTFRHVNIALVNELAVFAHQLGVNIWESIEAADTKPFGFMKFTPGPGVGGHCLPVDPSYLSWEVRRKLGRTFRFVELANDVNEHMPDYVVTRLLTLLNDHGKPAKGSRALILGLAYKKNTGDIRESPSSRIIELLHESGMHVAAVDSHVEEHRWPSSVEQVQLNAEQIESADIVVLLTSHDDLDLSIFDAHTTPVLDTKNVLSSPSAHRL